MVFAYLFLASENEVAGWLVGWLLASCWRHPRPMKRKLHLPPICYCPTFFFLYKARSSKLYSKVQTDAFSDWGKEFVHHSCSPKKKKKIKKNLQLGYHMWTHCQNPIYDSIWKTKLGTFFKQIWFGLVETRLRWVIFWMFLALFFHIVHWKRLNS
jgi:hypothetical protein